MNCHELLHHFEAENVTCTVPAWELSWSFHNPSLEEKRGERTPLKHRFYPFVLLDVEKTWCVSTSWGAHSAAETWDLLWNQLDGAGKKGCEQHWEMSVASNTSLACRHLGVKVMFSSFLCSKKKKKIIEMMKNGYICPCALGPASAELRRRVRNQVPWKIVECSTTGICSWSSLGALLQGKLFPRENEGKAHQLCIWWWGRPSSSKLGIFVWRKPPGSCGYWPDVKSYGKLSNLMSVPVSFLFPWHFCLLGDPLRGDASGLLFPVLIKCFPILSSQKSSYIFWMLPEC